MRSKHRNDKNHGKNGWVGGNPRYRGKGFQKGQRASTKQKERKMTDQDEANDLGTLVTNNCVTVSYDLIREAMKGEPYTLQGAGNDGKHVEKAVNQGIDSRLEACFCPSRGDRFEWKGGKLHCVVSVESFPVLVRRLFEMDNDENEGEPGLLASDMLMTLGFNDSGKLVGREALGLD
jgi:hypothetical protein